MTLARVAAMVAGIAVVTGACGGVPAPAGRAAPAPARAPGGPGIEIPFSVPGTLNTPLSVPPGGPGVAVTIPPESPCTIQASISDETLGFSYDSAVLSAEGRATLRSFVEGILANSVRLDRIEVLGYASSEGAEDYNLALSRARAGAVAQFLHGIFGLRNVPMRTDGRGEADPVADNATEEGRAANRRVVVAFHFVGCA